MTARLNIAGAWLDTRVAMRMDGKALAARRDALWHAMEPVVARTPALAKYAGRPIREVPVIDPTAMRMDIQAWNSVGIRSARAMEAARDAENGGTGIVQDDIVAGLSTGTSGARGLFLASSGERARYIGQSLARMLPIHAPVTGARIALVLRADSDLYRDAGKGRFSFLHVPLGLDPVDMAARLHDFRPTVLIAPPRELSSLARVGAGMPGLKRLLWGSEPMATLEREWITERLGVRPDPIYQATEGFIAAPCRHGTLHLNDDSMDIRLERVPGVDACRPIVTDLRRHVQPMVRVRMDDLVRLDPNPCRCGFAGRAVMPVSGRVQDVWHARKGDMLPNEVDDRMVAAVGGGARWRVRGSRDGVRLDIDDAALVGKAMMAIGDMMGDLPVRVGIRPDNDGAKRRRVTWGE